MGLRLSFGVGPLRASVPLTSRRRRRRSAPQGLQGTGEAYLPDGRHVRFVCGHNHRSRTAALECMAKRHKQIERGDSLHLVTKVLDTPESRQRDAERAAEKAMHQKERAAQKATRQRERADQKARRQEERAAQRQAHGEQQGAASQARKNQSAADREAARQLAPGRGQGARQTRAEGTAARREAARQLSAERKARKGARPPLSWPGWGNIAAGAAALTGIVLAGVAGSNANSPLTPVAALLLLGSVVTAAVCVPVAVWRKVQVRKRARAESPRPSHRKTVTPGFEAAHGLTPPVPPDGDLRD